MIIMELGGHVLESLGGIGLLIGEVSERRPVR